MGLSLTTTPQKSEAHEAPEPHPMVASVCITAASGADIKGSSLQCDGQISARHPRRHEAPLDRNGWGRDEQHAHPTSNAPACVPIAETSAPVRDVKDTVPAAVDTTAIESRDRILKVFKQKIVTLQAECRQHQAGKKLIESELSRLIASLDGSFAQPHACLEAMTVVTSAFKALIEELRVEIRAKSVRDKAPHIQHHDP